MSYNTGTGGSIHGASDVALNNPGDTQLLAFNGSTQKWVNTPLSVIGTAMTFGVIRPEDYGAVANGQTDDSAAITSALAAAQTASSGGLAVSVTVKLTAGKQYRIATSIIVPSGGNVTLDMNGATLVGPVTGWSYIDSSSVPSIPSTSDFGAQTAGACFTDNAGQSATIYNLKFVGGTIANFRYGFVSKCYAWAYARWSNVTFYGCNIGIFTYQGAQVHKVENCLSLGQGTTYVAAATCFATDHPFKNTDNVFCDGLEFDGIGWNRDSSHLNANFDTWFKQSILRPTTPTYTTGNQGGVFGFGDADSLGVSGRSIYIPQRSNRNTYGMNVRRMDIESSDRGALLVANPTNYDIANISGENLFASGPASMVVFLQDNQNSGSGSIRNIDAQNTTNPALFAVETRGGTNSTVFLSYSDNNAQNIQGPGSTRDDPFYTAFSHPSLFMHNALVARAYHTTSISSQTLTNIDSLFFTTPAAAAIIKFKAVIFYDTSDTSTGIVATINGPAASVINYRSEFATGINGRTFYEGLTSYQLPATVVSASASTVGNIAIIEGQVRTTASGVFRVQVASSNTNQIHVKEGSTLEYIYVSA